MSQENTKPAPEPEGRKEPAPRPAVHDVLAGRSTTSQPFNISLWLVSGLLAALFIVSGGVKFVGLMDDRFEAWGYTLGFAAMIGILEILGAVGLLIPRAAGWSAVGLMVIMLGAVWTLATHQDYGALVTPIVVFAALAFIAWGRGLPWETHSVEHREQPSG